MTVHSVAIDISNSVTRSFCTYLLSNNTSKACIILDDYTLTLKSLQSSIFAANNSVLCTPSSVSVNFVHLY